MAGYKCPLCGQEMQRDLAVYLDHTQTHVMDQIKKQHPEWVADDGACEPCAKYYEMQISGEAGLANIGDGGKRARGIVGGLVLLASLYFSYQAVTTPWESLTRFWLFIPFFIAIMGLYQSKKQTCAFLAVKGLKAVNGKNESVSDEAVAKKLKNLGRKILIQSTLISALLTLLVFFL